jgi:hypothetical protein
MKARCSLIALLWLGCAPGQDLAANDGTEPTPSTAVAEPSAAADRNDPARFIRLESLDAAEESSPEGVALDLRLHNTRGVSANSQIRVRIVTEHETRTVIVAGPSLPEFGAADIHISEASLALSDRPLHFSGQLRVDAQVTYADEMREESSSLFRHFHAEAGVWRAYDEQTRDERYAGGALSAELRAARSQIVAARAGEPVRFGMAIGSKISDDPTHVPQENEGASHE